MSSYIYSVLNDFPDGKINLDNLANEIRASSITIALDRLERDDDAVTIVFKAGLTGNEILTLEALFPAHNYTPAANISSVLVTNISTDADGQLISVVEKPTGWELLEISHNLCDPCTWYQEAVQVVGEAATQHATYVWLLGHQNIIDLNNGRLSRENVIEYAANQLGNSYKVSVTVNGTPYTERVTRRSAEIQEGEFGVDYELGEIYFVEDLTGATVLVSYYYENGSTWRLIPPAGYKAEIEYAEAQYSLDIEPTSDIVQVPEALSGAILTPEQLALLSLDGSEIIEIPGYKTIYKTIDNIIDEAVNGVKDIPAIGSGSRASQARRVMLFDYTARKILNSAIGGRFAAYLADETGLKTRTPWSGGRITFSLYGKYVPI